MEEKKRRRQEMEKHNEGRPRDSPFSPNENLVLQSDFLKFRGEIRLQRKKLIHCTIRITKDERNETNVQ